MKKINSNLLLLLSVLLIAFSAFSQSNTSESDKAIDSKTRNDVINEILKTIKDNYFSAELGEKMEKSIRQRMVNKEYDSITSAKKLAETLTQHLYEICKDRHVYVRFADNSNPTAPPPDMAREGNYGFSKIEILAGNIGYLKINAFPPPSQASEALAASMKFLQNTDALIIDLRQHRGGAVPMVALTVSYFVPEKPIHLLSSDFTRRNQKSESWTVEKVDAPRYLNKPVYLLTSNYTFSGGEEFAYDMQALKRAKLIGETTKGGANPVQLFSIQGVFRLGVSIAQVKSPITGTNWEGVGVKPDISTNAEKALDIALETAKKDLSQTNTGITNNESNIKNSNNSELTVFPETPVGKTFSAFLQAFNSGSKSELVKFHLSYLKNDEEGRRIAEENAGQDMGFYQNSSGLIPIKIISERETKIEVLVKFKQRNETVIFIMEVSSTLPHQITGLNVKPQ